QDDRVNGHFCRYTKRRLFDLCRTCSLRPVHAEYFFTFILPFLYLRKMVHPDRKVATKEEKLSLKLFPKWIDRSLFAMTQAEFILSPFLPNTMGGCLLFMAEKV